MRAKWEGMSQSLRNLPTYVWQDSETMRTFTLTPTEAIREVTLLSETGKKIVSAELNKMGLLQP